MPKSIRDGITHLTSRALLALGAACLLLPGQLFATGFTQGDLAVVVAAASAANTTCSVVEINTTSAAQSAIQTLPVPGTGTSAIRVSGSATSTLYVSDSNDGSLLCFTGANKDGDTSSNVNTMNPRAVVTVDAAGNINIATTYTGSSGSQTRGASSLNNSTFFIGDQGGFYSNGSTAASPSGNIRGVKAFGGTVYGFTSSASIPPVGIVSAATGGTFTALPGLANGATTRQDFYLVSSGSNGSTYDVLYVLDAASATVGTIYKYSLVSGSWTANGTYTTSFGGFGLCAARNGSGAVLYVTTGNGATTANNVVKLTDAAGYNSTIAITPANNVILYTTGTGTIIKGIAFAPTSSLALDNTGTPLAATVTTGSTSIPLFGFRLTPSVTANLTGLKVTATGTATGADLSNFQVVYDADNSGTYNAGDTVVSDTAQSFASAINFTFSTQTGLTGARRYLVIADVAAGATAGHTFTGSIAAASDVTASVTVNGTAMGALQTIATAVSDLAMTAVSGSEAATLSSVVNDVTIPNTTKGIQAWQVTFSNPAGNAGAGTITGIKVTSGPNNQVANWQNVILAAELFDGNTALGAGTIAATNISFSGLNLTVADGGSKTLTLRISLSAAAGALMDHAGLQFGIAGPDVLVTGNSVTTASINSDASQDLIAVVATRLVFNGIPTIVLTNKIFSASVTAQDSNGNLDLDTASLVTISQASGSGTLTGGDGQFLFNGTNKWVILVMDTPGPFTLTASDGVLTPATSSLITARVQPTLTDVLVPQYIEGIASGSSNSKRVPYAYLVTISNLAPNSVYRYYNQGVSASDSATSDGAGNVIFANTNGAFTRTTSPSMSTTGGYGTFVSDANGSYTGWFLNEPTGNSRFATTGNAVFFRIMLNDGSGGTGVFARVTTTESAAVLPFGTDTASGTGIYGNSSAANQNFVVLYDNVAGTGRPLAAALAESDGVAETTGNSYVQFYNDSVDGVAGAWGTIVPNNNANGVQRIEQRALLGGSLIASNTDADGVWPSGVNTVNPAGGATPLVITATDAPLSGVVVVTTPVVTGIQITGGNVLIDFTGGATDSVGNFTVLGTTNLMTALAPVSAVITSPAAGSFRATLPAGTGAAFFRIQR